MTPAKRLEAAFHLARLARALMLDQTAQDHPDWTEPTFRLIPVQIYLILTPVSYGSMGFILSKQIGSP